MDSPRLTIITVTYNAEAVLGKTLASLSALPFRDFEHLIVDGESFPRRTKESSTP
jgi:glycosyltransferase involved in cell wall biosynthesis